MIDMALLIFSVMLDFFNYDFVDPLRYALRLPYPILKIAINNSTKKDIYQSCHTQFFYPCMLVATNIYNGTLW